MNCPFCATPMLLVNQTYYCNGCKEKLPKENIDEYLKKEYDSFVRSGI